MNKNYFKTNKNYKNTEQNSKTLTKTKMMIKSITHKQFYQISTISQC